VHVYVSDIWIALYHHLAYTTRFQAINNLAVTDENKEMIIEAGALPLYVKLLSPDCDESVQRDAAKGIWSFAFKCKKRILAEPGCVEGCFC